MVEKSLLYIILIPHKMPINISEEKKNSIKNRINALYEMCGNLNPIVYFIEGLTNQFKSILGTDCKAFEITLREAENSILLYYNRDGVNKDIAESQSYKHLLVYKVQPTNECESRYFFHLDLANLF